MTEVEEEVGMKQQGSGRGGNGSFASNLFTSSSSSSSFFFFTAVLSCCVSAQEVQST